MDQNYRLSDVGLINRDKKLSFRFNANSLVFGSHINHGVGHYVNLSASSCMNWQGRTRPNVNSRLNIENYLIETVLIKENMIKYTKVKKLKSPDLSEDELD